MTDEQRKEGAAETLRGAALIVLVGLALGVAFNALGLASRPPRGLSWIAKPERMPSLEELQPGSQAVPAPAPARRSAPGFSLVGTAWAQEAAVLAAAGDSTHARPAKHAVVKKKASATRAGAAKASATKAGAKKATAAKGAAKAAAKPAAPAPAASAPAPPAAKADLPVVPDLDQPIDVKLPNVKKFFDAGAAVLVDAREASEYSEGHIPGALSIPTNDAVANPALLEPLKKAGKPIIAYCSGGDCEESKDLAKNMIAAGIRKVLVFTDGFPAWKGAGYPVETGPPGAGR